MTENSTTATRLPVWTMPVRIGAALTVTILGLLAYTALVRDGAAGETTALGSRILAGIGLTAVVAVLILFLTRVFEKRRLRDIGLTPPGDAWRAFLSGVGAWLLPAAVTFGVLALIGMPLSVTAPADAFWATLGLVSLAVLLSEAIPEELVFRGYITAVLAERLGGWWVILVQTALFVLTVLILRGELAPLDLSMFIAMGFVLGYLRMLTGSIWTTIGFHTAFQTGSQLVLTHEVVAFGGSEFHAMLALGMVPFTVAAVGVALLAPVAPRLFARG